MKKIKTSIAFLSGLTLTGAITAPILTSCGVETKILDYHLLSINDIHGAMAGYGEDIVNVSESTPGSLRLARELNKVRKQCTESVFLSGGDENSGDAWSVCDHAGTTYPILSAMDCRYAAVGNHAFEWGLDDLSSGRYDTLARTKNTNGKYFVCSNILSSNEYQLKNWCIDEKSDDFINDFNIWNNQTVKWADPYKLINFGKATICLIGLATQNTLVDGNKKIASQFSFIDYNASVHYTKYLARRELGEERYNSIDSFVLLTHLDSDYKDNILTGEATRLACKIDTDIDAIISAHSHKTGCGKMWNNKLNKAICVGQAGSAGQNILDTELTINPKADAGKRVLDVNMKVHKVSVTKDAEAAKKEWTELRNTTDPDLKPVAKAYEKQRLVVGEKIGEVLSKNTLDPTVAGQTQTDPATSKAYDGYYNGAVHGPDKPGHYYYDCKTIIDHAGAWANRAAIIGYAVKNWARIGTETEIPSVSFLTQDSLPGEIKTGNITQRDMFTLQPYDNYIHYGYLNIFQLANILNYSLAGNPEVASQHKGKGFSYTDKNQFEPDLCYYVTKESKTADPVFHQTALNITDSKGIPDINSGYTCGMLSWYGCRFEVVEIDKQTGERDFSYTNPKTLRTQIPLFDKSAKYRIATQEVKVHEGTTEEQTIVLPKIWVYDGFTNGKPIKWGSLDRIDDMSEETGWKSAKYWYELEHPTAESKNEPRLIPFICNSFNYGGGNTQTRMFKAYAEYNILQYGLQFIGEDTAETIRDFLVTFCKSSYPDVKEWAEQVIPTNIPWSLVEKMVTIK